MDLPNCFDVLQVLLGELKGGLSFEATALTRHLANMALTFQNSRCYPWFLDQHCINSFQDLPQNMSAIQVALSAAQRLLGEEIGQRCLHTSTIVVYCIWMIVEHLDQEFIVIFRLASAAFEFEISDRCWLLYSGSAWQGRGAFERCCRHMMIHVHNYCECLQRMRTSQRTLPTSFVWVRMAEFGFWLPPPVRQCSFCRWGFSFLSNHACCSWSWRVKHTQHRTNLCLITMFRRSREALGWAMFRSKPGPQCCNIWPSLHSPCGQIWGNGGQNGGGVLLITKCL